MLEIIPDKFTPVSGTVVGQASALLAFIALEQRSVGQLFVESKRSGPTQNFDDFATALTFLFGAGLIKYQDGILRLS